MSDASSQQAHRNVPAIPNETAIATLILYAHAQTFGEVNYYMST